MFTPANCIRENAWQGRCFNKKQMMFSTVLYCILYNTIVQYCHQISSVFFPYETCRNAWCMHLEYAFTVHWIGTLVYSTKCCSWIMSTHRCALRAVACTLMHSILVSWRPVPTEAWLYLLLHTVLYHSAICSIRLWQNDTGCS